MNIFSSSNDRTLDLSIDAAMTALLLSRDSCIVLSIIKSSYSRCTLDSDMAFCPFSHFGVAHSHDSGRIITNNEICLIGCPKMT